MDGEAVGARFIVRGRVQGVWFRAGTRDVAERLGLAGHARNLDDGGVEVLAIGDADAIARLREWLGQGPPLAKVDSVDCVERFGRGAMPVPSGFAIG